MHFPNALNYGVKGDGVTDDTVAIQLFLDSTAGQGSVYFPQTPGGYRVTATLFPAAQTTVHGAGWGTYFTMDGAWAGSKGLFDLTAKSQVSMQDFRIEGQKATKSGTSTARGVYVANSNYTRFSRLYLHDCSHAGILWDGATRFGVAEACHVVGGGDTVTGGQTNGISVDTNMGASSDFSIIGNTFENIPDCCVGIHNNSNTVTISGNVMDGGGVGRAVDIAGAQGVSITGNVVKNRTGNNLIGVYDNLATYVASDVSIVGNTLVGGQGVGQNGIYVAGTSLITSGVVISGNRIKNMTSVGIAVLLGSTNLDITGNIVGGCTSHGIYLDCGAQAANFLDNAVMTNHCRQNGGYGVWLHPSITSGKVQCNHLSGNTSGGTNINLTQKTNSLQWFGNGPQDTDNTI